MEVVYIFHIFVFIRIRKLNFTTMIKLASRRIAATMIVSCFISSVAFSQFDNVDFLRSATTDGAKFIEAYISPWANAFGAGMNGSWYNTAKPHKLGGFDITIGINVGVVPTSAQTFDVSSIGLSSSLSGTGDAPTVAGPGEDGPQMTYSIIDPTYGSIQVASFKTPPGTDWKYVPVPTAQVGIGLPLGTELKIRYIPKIKIKDGDVSLWGLGLMHSIVQYLPGNKLLPVDASLFAGYTRLTANVPLSLMPDDSYPWNYTTYDQFTAFDNQNMCSTVEALNISAIGSLNLPVITFYGGLGYSKTRTLVKLEGNFPLPSVVTPAAAAPYVEYNDSGVKKGNDFPDIDVKNFSGLRANIGFRIKLAVITIHADYTRAQYNVLSTGLGISFR